MQYNTDPATTMQRALAAGARLGWNVTQANEAMGFVTFNTGRSLRTWGGQNVSVTIAGTPHGSLLTFNAHLASHTQFTSWGEAKKVFKAFTQAMGA